MATTPRTQGVIVGGALAIAALIAGLLWSRNEASVPAPAPAASPSSQKTVAALERWKRLNAHTQTCRLMALRVLRENRIEARLAELYCMDIVCRGTLVEGTPDEYARWADLMSRDTSTRFASFQWSLHTVDGNRRMNVSIDVPTPEAAP